MLKRGVKTAIEAVLDRRRRRLGEERARCVHQLLDGENLHVIDVGASGGSVPRWKPCHADMTFIGLEPDGRSVDKLMHSDEAKEFKEYRLIPSGAWSAAGDLEISFTRKPKCSSHFQPNADFLSRFPEAARFEVVSKGRVKCDTLDRLLGDLKAQADFIKLDLEGGELAILKGAERILEDCLGLQVEVCFQPLRVDQPLFGEVTTFLEQRGQNFIDFVALMRWERAHARGFGQVVVADALYLRAPEEMIERAKRGAVDARRLKRYVSVLALYDRWDLAAKALELACVANLSLDEDYLQIARSLLARKEALLSKRATFLARLSYLYTSWANPGSRLHYVY